MIWQYVGLKGFIVTKPTVRKAPLRFFLTVLSHSAKYFSKCWKTIMHAELFGCIMKGCTWQTFFFFVAIVALTANVGSTVSRAVSRTRLGLTAAVAQLDWEEQVFCILIHVSCGHFLHTVSYPKTIKCIILIYSFVSYLEHSHSSITLKQLKKIWSRTLRS